MMKEGGDQENKPSSARGSLGRLPDPQQQVFCEGGTVTAAEEQESTPEIEGVKAWCWRLWS